MMEKERQEEAQIEGPVASEDSPEEDRSNENLVTTTSQIFLIGHGSQSSVNPSGNTFVMKFDQIANESGEDLDLESPDDDVKYLIEVISLSKTYGKGPFSKRVLKCVNMNVLPGRIYVIYGAADSGKSTLLKSLLGLIVPTVGYIRYNLSVIKQKPKYAKIRYMPESEGIYLNCTVHENVMLFGRLNNFSQSEIDRLFNDVINRLYVRSCDMRVGQMDRMQRVRLSFFISSMSRPNILLLDEPTAGVDPIVKHELWTQMRFMQRNWGTTILLTSSDSDECMRADYVSFLRHGQIIVAARPNQILDKWNVDSMEKAFYCMAVRSGDLLDDPVPYHQVSYEPRYRDSYVKNSWLHRKGIYTEFRKNFPCPTKFHTSQGVLLQERFLALWRNKVTYLLLGLVIPYIILLTFYYSIGQEVYKAKIGALYCDACNGTVINNFNLDSYCQTLKMAQEQFPLMTFYSSHQRLEEDMSKGVLRAMISYNQHEGDFERVCQKSDKSFRKTLIDSSNTAKNVSNKMFHPVVTIDGSEKIVASRINSLISKVKEQMRSKNMRRSSPDMIPNESLKVTTRFKTVNLEADKVVLGILALLTFHTGAFLAAYSMISSQKTDLTDRLLVLGVRHCQLQLSHWISNLLLVAVSDLCLTGVVLRLINESLIKILTLQVWILSMCLSIAGVAVGMLLSGLLSKFMVVSVLLNTFTVIGLLFSGTLWPLEGLPYGLDWISEAVPQTYTLRGYQALIFKEFDLMNDIVLQGIWVPLAWACVSYTIFLCNIIYKLNKI